MARGILDILVAGNALTLEEAGVIRKTARSKNLSIEDELLARGVDDTKILKAKGEAMGIPTASLKSVKVPFDILKSIPEESARHYQFVPIGSEGGVVHIGIVDPENIDAKEALKFIATRLNQPFKIFLISKQDLNSALEEYKGISGEVTKVLGELETAIAEEPALPKALERSGTSFSEEAPITKMVAVILRHATEGRASDIHIEPGRDKLRVRFRVDGVLYTSLFLPIGVTNAVVSRIKIMSNLKIDETRIPQDGLFHAEVLDKEIDVRVATFPTSFGEKAVLRILDPEVGIKTFAGLGLAGRNLAALKAAITKPYGMIVISGPTGSGKSTTLYAILSALNQEARNIVSLEDPVEYTIAGVNQSQVRPEIGYDFANGLRQILRQDPDIIMVGEVRDKETAQLAIHAALTGHLVLTTLHTNNAVGIIPRLVDMGIEPFLLPSSVAVGIAQRLARRLCEDSRREIRADPRVRAIIEDEIAVMPRATRRDAEELWKRGMVHEGVVSAACPKGTRGRIGLFEVVEMTPDLEKIILEGFSEAKIEAESRRQGMVTMRQDGIFKVLDGIIGMRELLEVV